MFNFGLYPFCGQIFEVSFICLEDAHVVQSREGCCKGGIGFVVIEDEETYTAIVWHEGKQLREVVVHNAAIFVQKRPKTEHIGNGLIVVVYDDVGAHVDALCRARVHWDLLDDW